MGVYMAREQWRIEVNIVESLTASQSKAITERDDEEMRSRGISRLFRLAQQYNEATPMASVESLLRQHAALTDSGYARWELQRALWDSMSLPPEAIEAAFRAIDRGRETAL
jgi:hypothetical protein